MNIIPVFLVYPFNVKSILCIVDWMIIRKRTMITSNFYNRTPESDILFTDICVGDFFNRHDFMKH